MSPLLSALPVDPYLRLGRIKTLARSYRSLLLAGAALLGLSGAAGAATYYVATNGSNTTGNGSLASPWQTIQYAANIMAAGDTCQIRAGVYRETVIVPRSGAAGSPITFQPYGSEVVTVSGTDAIPGGWTLESTNVYYAAMTGSLGDGNQVFQGTGTQASLVMKPEARWPNAGASFPWQNSAIKPSPDWAYIDSASYDANNQNGTLTDASLPARAAGYWVGATVHVMGGYGWIMQFPTVTSSTGTTLTTNDANGANAAYKFTAGNEYYITGIKGEMDSPGEWFYDTTHSRLYLYSNTGAPTNVEAKKRNYGFDLRGRAYVTLKNLDFFACTIQTDSGSTFGTYDGLSMKFLGHSVKNSSVYGLQVQANSVLRNSELAWDSQALVSARGNARIINNYLHDSGYIPGWTPMAGGSGARNLITYNTMTSAGREIMGAFGSAAIIDYNDLSNAMRLGTDGGVLHCGSAEAGNSIFCYNLLHDSPGPAGHLGASVMGFYLDNQSSDWVVHHNIIWNLPGYAMQINCTQNFIQFFNNTCWNATKGALLTSFPMDEESGTHIFNNLFNGPPVGGTWDLSDIRYNLYTDPQFVAPASHNFQLQSTSPAINQGTPIPGVTDGYLGAAPDMGALEYGGTDWTGLVGYKTVPPSPDPVYSMPAMSFANQVKDGSFESGALSPNWSTTGTVTLLSGTAWTDPRLRTGSYDLQFGVGATSEVSQTVSGLLPNRRYKVYGGVRRTDASTVVKLGVRNYGFNAVETVADVIDRTTPLAPGESRNGDATWWTEYNRSFVTGPSSTSAQIYLDVTIPAGNSPVYADDFGVELMEEQDPQPGTMPLLEYPLNETSGVTAHDATTYGLNGTLNGGATWGPGVTGNALYFNGTDAYLTTPAMATPTEITVGCWAKSNTATWNDNGFLVSKRPSFVLHPNMGTKDVRFFVTIGGVAQTVYFTAPATFDITQWHHYAGVYSPSLGRLAIYVDGVYSASAAVTGAIDPDSGQVFIGKDDYTGRFFNGAIDDVRIYNRALSNDEVAVDFNLDPSLVLRYKLDETTGATQVWDASSNGLNGAVNGSATWTTGKVDGAIALNGTNAYVTSPVMASPLSEITVGCWAKSNTTTWNDYGFLVSKRPSFVLHPNMGTKDVRFFVTIGGVAKTVYFTAPAGFDITQWHHYLGEYSATAGLVSIYVDGVFKGSVSATGNIDPDSGQIFIGKDDYPGRFFNGTIDDVQIYSRALSWDEVLDLSVRTNGPPY